MFDSHLVQASKLRRGPWIAVCVTVRDAWSGWGPEDVPVPDSDLEAQRLCFFFIRAMAIGKARKSPKGKRWKQPGPKYCTERRENCRAWWLHFWTSEICCILLNFNDKLRAFGYLRIAWECRSNPTQMQCGQILTWCNLFQLVPSAKTIRSKTMAFHVVSGNDCSVWGFHDATCRVSSCLVIINPCKNM